ncbi:hypothetical protein GGR01_001596 [Acetobacter oeni]|nr:hypothetical protein [Acetobacter oeni]
MPAAEPLYAALRGGDPATAWPDPANSGAPQTGRCRACQKPSASAFTAITSRDRCRPRGRKLTSGPDVAFRDVNETATSGCLVTAGSVRPCKAVPTSEKYGVPVACVSVP